MVKYTLDVNLKSHYHLTCLRNNRRKQPLVLIRAMGEQPDRGRRGTQTLSNKAISRERFRRINPSTYLSCCPLISGQ